MREHVMPVPWSGPTLHVSSSPQTLLPPADTRVAPGAPLAVLRLDNSPGGPSTDVLFKAVPLPDGTPYEIINGSTLVRPQPWCRSRTVATLTPSHLPLPALRDEFERALGRCRPDDGSTPERLPCHPPRRVRGRAGDLRLP